MDVIGGDAPERRPLPPWLVGWAVRAVGVAALLVAGAGIVAAAQFEPVVAGPVVSPLPSVDVVSGGGEAQRQGNAVTGVLELVVVNRTERPAAVRALTLEAAGLDVLSVEPGDAPPLGPFAQRQYVVRYAVPDCDRLQLPGRVALGLRDPDADRVKRRTVPLRDPSSPGSGVDFAPCRPSFSPPPSLTVRALGGSTTRTADGARGEVRLEVRNSGAALRLLEVTAEVPGVRFAQLAPARGIVLQRDERIELVLGFEIGDCQLLRRTGRLVLRAVDRAAVTELGLTITTDREAGTLREVAFDRVLQACPR